MRHTFSIYSRILLSRAPLTCENQLLTLAHWTPNFSGAPLATAHMTDPITHSKFLHSRIHHRRHDNPLISVTASKCTIPTCWAAQDNLALLSQTYFTHSAPILTPGNQPLTVNKQWPPLRESRTRYVTLHSLQNGNCHDELYISWYKCSLQVDTTIDTNTILYFYCVEKSPS